MNENVEIKIFGSPKRQKTYDTNDEIKITDAIRKHVMPGTSEEYHSVKVKVKRGQDTKPKYLVTYMLRKDTYTADITKIEIDENYGVTDIKRDYDDSLEHEDEIDEDAEEESYAAHDFIVATCVPEISTAKVAVDYIFKVAKEAGLKPKVLLGEEASVGQYKAFLRTGLKGFVNIGHGSATGIVLSDGTLSYTWFNSLSGTPVSPAVVYFNSCQVFNKPLQSAVMNAGARTYIGGIPNLLIGPSEEVCKCFWTKVLLKNGLMGNCLKTCEKAHYPSIGAHGLSGDEGLFSCKRSIALRAVSDRFVCAEGGGGKNLIADRPWIRSWETFSLVDLGGNKVALQADNGKYVCAEGGGGRELVANRAWVRSWETFTLHNLGGNKIALQACNGQYVCAENAGKSRLMANRDHIRSWETFELIKLTRIGLIASNGKYVCAEDAGKKPLVANRDKLRSWETFTLIELGKDKFALMAVNRKYVCARNGGRKSLLANRNWIRSWETFKLGDLGHQITIKAVNNKYVSAEGSNELIAKSSTITKKEKFTLENCL